MQNKKADNITIAIYKGHSRYKVITISQSLFRLLITLNSVLIIGCIIFFLSFLFQWASNWKIVEKNKTITKELLLLKQQKT